MVGKRAAFSGPPTPILLQGLGARFSEGPSLELHPPWPARRRSVLAADASWPSAPAWRIPTACGP